MRLCDAGGMDSLPAYDPALHDEVAQAQGLIPAAMDGFTHYCSSRGDKTHPKCGAAQGTQLSRNWALVDCLDCRGEERPDPFAPAAYRLSSRGDEHTFEYGDDHVQRCTRCRLPHAQWAGGPCLGRPVDWKPGSYV